MKYVDFYGHKVSKLIIGDNPFNGHSYIPEFVSKEEMIEYHTEDKILEAMHKMEELGINTMLPLADPYIIRILQHYRSNGGKMNFIFQTYAPMMTSIESAEITSPFNSLHTSIASLLFPEAVGPTITTTFFLSITQFS